MSDPTLSDVAAKALAELLQTVQSGKEFVLAQAPEVIQQMVTYYMVTGWLMALGALVGIGASLLCSWFVYRKSVDNCDGALNIFQIVIAIPLILCIIGFITSMDQALCATFAPKWFIVSELAKLIK